MKIVFDMDGVLSDDTDRLKFIARKSNQNWAAYFDSDNISRDHPILPTMKVFWSCRHLIPQECEIWTGRPSRLLLATKAWLRVNLLKMYKSSLIEAEDEFEVERISSLVNIRMRPSGSRMANHEFKLSLHKTVGPASIIFDNNIKVIDTFKKEEVATCHVNTPQHKSDLNPDNVEVLYKY